ncbi:L,D-transpeptidase family protein [Antarcticirhabdus aurantiaca]|uniref:L,D-transpeptidase family protein n=1 Tax=Antarcticirhabdus aurantiaca TaxID=2606717 RepID=UPI003BB66E42
MAEVRTTSLVPVVSRAGGVTGMVAGRLARAAVLAASLFTLGACQGIEDLVPANKPLPHELVELIQKQGMGTNSPILVRIFKEESELEVWKQKTDGTYAKLKTYPICAWSGNLGPKQREGDRQAPEGFYTVTPAQLNPDSQYHLAFNMGYPNTFDRANARTGTHLMVHGSCSSAGCYAMDDAQIEEIYALARHSFGGGQRAFQIQAYPFRMTPKNMARHRNSEHYAFWKMLKRGSDYLETTHRQPVVGVCEKRYVFDLDAETAKGLDPDGPCPEMTPPISVAAKAISDEAEEQRIASSMAPSEFATYSSFAYKMGDRVNPEAFRAEQHRRQGRDRYGNLVDGGRSPSIFGSFIGR